MICGGGTCGTHGGEFYAHTVWAGKPTGEKPLERPWNRWKYNISPELKNYLIVRIGFIWRRIGTKCRAVVDTVMKFRFKKNAQNFFNR